MIRNETHKAQDIIRIARNDLLSPLATYQVLNVVEAPLIVSLRHKIHHKYQYSVEESKAKLFIANWETSRF